MTRSILIAAVLAIAASGWIASGQFGDDPAEYQAAEAATPRAEDKVPAVRVRLLVAEPRVTEIALFGRTASDRAVEVRAETAGRIIAVDVKKGATVAKGDVIARIAQEDRPARLADAEAQVEKTRVAYEASRQLQDRAHRSRVQLVADKAALEAAQAALASIKIELANTIVRAPFSGSVQELPVEVGDYLKIAEPVATIVDLDPLVIVGQIVEGDVGHIKTGDSAQVRIGGGVAMPGAVRFVSRTADEATRTFAVEVAVSNPEGVLSQGLTAELRLPVNELMAHRVSPAVLSLSDEGAIGVKIVDADNEVEFVPVSIVADTPEGIWLAGLPDKIMLITVGQEFVVAGQKVKPVAEGNLAPSAAPIPEQDAPRGPVPIANRGTL